MESLGMEISADVKTAALEAPTKSVSDIVQICTRESEELSRLRANPIRENAVRFARDLKCEISKRRSLVCSKASAIDRKVLSVEPRAKQPAPRKGGRSRG